MNPPEVSVETEDVDVELILEYVDEVLEMAGEVMRQLTEEELEVLRLVGEVLGQWEEFEFTEYV
jgi:hypothetical protein